MKTCRESLADSRQQKEGKGSRDGPGAADPFGASSCPLHSIRNLKCCFHFQMEFLKVKLNALQQKAQMFSYEINGALKNTLHNMIG